MWTRPRRKVSQKRAALAVAKTNLDYTVIRSPIDSIVDLALDNVDVGQTVAASLQAPTIFTIAQDLTKMQVYAKVDESDVGRIKMGQTVTFKVDAFPTEVYSGAVSQIRMNATTVQNVVTYDCIIDFANPRLQLFPGMTAYVTIPVATAENAVKIPNAALRYKPPISVEALRALYEKFGIRSGSGAETGASGGSGTAGQGARHSPGADQAVVWKLLADGGVEPVEVTLGITDHTSTELPGCHYRRAWAGRRLGHGCGRCQRPAGKACREFDVEREWRAPPFCESRICTKSTSSARPGSTLSEAWQAWKSSAASWFCRRHGGQRQWQVDPHETSSAVSTVPPPGATSSTEPMSRSSTNVSSLRSGTGKLGFVFQGFNLLAANDSPRERRAADHLQRNRQRGAAPALARCVGFGRPLRPVASLPVAAFREVSSSGWRSRPGAGQSAFDPARRRAHWKSR